MFKKIVGLGFSTKGKNSKDVEKYIDGLVSSGATEFFTGYNPNYWSEKFGFEVSPNGRFAEHEQITDFEILKQIVFEVKKHNLEIFINLNAWYYSKETMPLIKKMVGEFEDIGVDGIICGNIGILEYLKNIGYSGKINISTILSLYNKEAIKFILKNYKINKIILSREVTLKEIEEIVLCFPKTKFEIFGEGDFCRYNNGLCFAEHKYSSKDICTIVVNDLIIKRKFNPNFKEIILDKNLSNEEKTEKLNDDYLNIFDEIKEILLEIDLNPIKKKDLDEKLFKIIEKSKNRTDLFFDALKPINSQKNTNIINYLKALKYLDREEFLLLRKEMERSVESGMKYLFEKTKEVGGKPKLKALELANFYSRGDNLNLYSYLFFSKFKNIETVKFPTRGRNYNKKLEEITKVVELGKIDEKKFFDRGISIERTHYDLTYLFGNKLWFREMISNL